MHGIIAHSLKLYSVSKVLCTIMRYPGQLTFNGEKSFTDFFLLYFFCKTVAWSGINLQSSCTSLPPGCQ